MEDVIQNEMKCSEESREVLSLRDSSNFVPRFLNDDRLIL